MSCVVLVGCPFTCCDVNYDCPFYRDQCYYYPYVFPYWIPITASVIFLLIVLMAFGIVCGRRRRIRRMREAELAIISTNNSAVPVYGTPVMEGIAGPYYQGQPYQSYPQNPGMINQGMPYQGEQPYQPMPQGQPVQLVQPYDPVLRQSVNRPMPQEEGAAGVSQGTDNEV